MFDLEKKKLERTLADTEEIKSNFEKEINSLEMNLSRNQKEILEIDIANKRVLSDLKNEWKVAEEAKLAHEAELKMIKK